MNESRKYTIIIVILTAAAIFTSFFLDIKIVMTLLFTILLLGSFLIKKEKVGGELIVAFLMALALTSYYEYIYTTLNPLIGKINMFPLIAWTFGLVILREVYEKVKWEHKLLKISFLYVSLLFVIEYIGFYLLNIRLSGSYPSLLNMGIIHAPIGMKAFYLLAGPVYLLITDYLKVE